MLQQGFRETEITALPDILRSRKGRFGLTDYEKAFCPDLKNGRDIYDMRGIDRTAGCIVVVRPDQYVAHVLPLDAYHELAAFSMGSCWLASRPGRTLTNDGKPISATAFTERRTRQPRRPANAGEAAVR